MEINAYMQELLSMNFLQHISSQKAIESRLSEYRVDIDQCLQTFMVSLRTFTFFSFANRKIQMVSSIRLETKIEKVSQDVAGISRLAEGERAWDGQVCEKSSSTDPSS